MPNTRLTVIGAGVSGQGLALLAHKLGDNVFVSEQRVISQEARDLFDRNNIPYEQGHTEQAFTNTMALLISSGIPPSSPVLHEAQSRGIKLIGELDYTLPHIKARNLICVTGSNGKSTVTSLIGHILAKAGLKTGTGGNLGTASSRFTDEDFDAVVLELSSFQLARAENTIPSSVSIITNLAPDHIDWHGSYEAYIEAKNRVLTLRAPGSWGIIQDIDAEVLKPAGNIITLSRSPEPVHRYAGHIFMDSDRAILTLNGESSVLFEYAQSPLIGSHNDENAAMSLCAVKLLGINNGAGLLPGFHALPHRCENAGIVDGVRYIDDSKGTNVAATITAMKSIAGRKVIILGGQGKGEDYGALAGAVKQECDAAVLIGEEAAKIREALVHAGFENVHDAASMEQAVDIAQSLAKPGMIVLLSPACTSWDMYKSYKARGEHFCRIVREKPSWRS